jgi:hypothetical protein
MGQKPKRKNHQGLSHFQKIGIGILVLVICTGLYTFVAWAASSFSITTTYAEGEEARILIEKFLNTSIPDSAQDVQIAYTAWIDFIAKMRFSLVPEVAEQWLSDNEWCFDELSEMRMVNLPFIHPDSDWWQPNLAEQSVGGECGSRYSSYSQILIDQTDNEMWIIYIQKFTESG